MIPKHIFTYWLSDSPELPSLIKKCIDSQKLQGYTHHIITLENCDRSSEYVRQSLENKRWVKATDYLRCQYMYKHGGICLDGDMEILPEKTFDDLLDNRMFMMYECAGLYANAGFGSEPGHPLLKQYLDRVDTNYKGSGDLIFEPGIRTFNDIFWAGDKSTFKMVDTTTCFPYNHLTGKINITPFTKVYHHYCKSWVK